MIPASYHEFFAGCANVAGALVGLLFVAISVSPSKPTGGPAATDFQIRAAAAFSALVNALVVTLFALLPQTNLGTVALITAIGGLSSTAGLIVLQAREPGSRRVRDFVLIVFLLPVYADQLRDALRLIHRPGETGALQGEAIIVVVCFLIGIVRAWELLGIRATGLVHTAFALRRSAQPTGAPAEVVPTDPGPARPDA